MREIEGLARAISRDLGVAGREDLPLEEVIVPIVVRLDPKVLQAFLDINSDGTAAAPQADDETGAKTVIVDRDPQPKRVRNQFFFRNKVFPGHSGIVA